MKVAALTFGTEECASSYYRIFQLREPLKSLGVTLTAFEANHFKDWESLSDYDAVILQKRLFSPKIIRSIRKHSKVLIYDTDDAVWEPHGKKHHIWTRWRTEWRLRATVKAADACLVANGYLKDALVRRGGRVQVLPMALDESIWQPQTNTLHGPLRIGWAGAPVNLTYLNQLSPLMLRLQASPTPIEWVVYCGQPPALPAEISVTHIPFQKGTEAQHVQTFAIGLLPLPANDFANGKSPIKALQYMACGVPFVSDRSRGAEELLAGSTAGRLVHGLAEWQDALEQMIRSPELRADMGATGRQVFLSRHSTTATAHQLAESIQRLKNVRG